MRAGPTRVPHQAFSTAFEDADGMKAHFINQVVSKSD